MERGGYTTHYISRGRRGKGHRRPRNSLISFSHLSAGRGLSDDRPRPVLHPLQLRAANRWVSHGLRIPTRAANLVGATLPLSPPSSSTRRGGANDKNAVDASQPSSGGRRILWARWLPVAAVGAACSGQRRRFFRGTQEESAGVEKVATSSDFNSFRP